MIAEFVNQNVLSMQCAEHDYNEDDKEKWLEINKKYSEIWPNISKKKNSPEDADKFKEIKGKYDKFFSEKPGK